MINLSTLDMIMFAILCLAGIICFGLVIWFIIQSFYRPKHKYKLVVRNRLGYKLDCIVFARSEENAVHYWCKYIRHPEEGILEIIDLGEAK